MSRRRNANRAGIALGVSAVVILLCCGLSTDPPSLVQWTMGGEQDFQVSQTVEKSGVETAARSGQLSPLAVVEAGLRLRYGAISHLSPDDLDNLRKRGDVVLVDVREANEFDVSHLGGATRVSPGDQASDVLEVVGNPQGKSIVFYCSVGVRSSALAERARQTLMQHGAAGVYNLSGGIFRWHNEARELVHRGRATDLVHKYDDTWGRLIKRQDLAVTRAAKD